MLSDRHADLCHELRRKPIPTSASRSTVTASHRRCGSTSSGCWFHYRAPGRYRLCRQANSYAHRPHEVLEVFDGGTRVDVRGRGAQRMGSGHPATYHALAQLTGADAALAGDRSDRPARPATQRGSGGAAGESGGRP
jgi:hypothetical protein